MKNTGVKIVLLLLAAGSAIGLFGVRSWLKTGPAAPGLSSAPVEPPSGKPSNLPALEASDDFVRVHAAMLSSDSSFMEWLKLDALIPRLISAMSRITQGQVPRETFAAFAPGGKFLVTKKNGKVFVDPSGFTRYDRFAALVNGVDAVAAANLFTELLPLFDAAQRGLGEKNTSAREAFFSASRELLQTPTLEGETILKDGGKGVGWAYDDERLENLSPAQKQLLRMGPKNETTVQTKLRAVILALGGR